MLDLTELFSLQEIEDAFSILSQRRYKKTFGQLRRFSSIEQRQENALGLFLSENDTRKQEFYESLKDFQFTPYTGMQIKKASGKSRPLLIPHPKDRIVLQAALPKIQNIILPVLRRHNALGVGIKPEEEIAESKKIVDEISTQLSGHIVQYALTLDFKDYFSSLDREVLLDGLKTILVSPEGQLLLSFVGESINNKIEADCNFWGTFGHLKLGTKGIPQGLSYSPLLASFYASPLDYLVNNEKDCIGYRYLDDMIVLTDDSDRLQNIYEKIETKSRELGLELHPLSESGKTRIVDCSKQPFKFLGIEMDASGVYIPKKAICNFKEVFEQEIVNTTTIRSQQPSDITEVFQSFATGWTSHYKTLCPNDYERVRDEINDYISSYINKKKERRTFFGGSELKLV